MELEGKVALVTGAAKGIGRAAVEVMLREGARVLLLDCDSQAGEAALASLSAASGRAAFLTADISKPDHARAAVDRAVALFARLDILVNNAGIQCYGDAVEISEELWDRTLDVNLKGGWLMTKFSVPAMLASGGGSIVNVASVQGLVAQRGACAYGTSKHAMIGLTRTCAVDFASRGIRVNCVCPGSIDTPMLQSTIQRAADPAALRRILDRLHPIGRIGRPAEVAEVICFLASDRASFMTGSIVVVDGGLIVPVSGSPEE
jgi:NAD(P)-dependent dehydrogenase (short-subunit alcohol dehydrogenase family)